MPDHEALFQEHLSLASRIAAGYTNIPGVQLDDVVSVARQALHRAAEGYDASRGAFEQYAARAIRNALNNFFTKQARHAKVEVAESLVPCLDSTGEPVPLATRLADSKQDIVRQVGQQESHAVLLRLMAELPTRTQDILRRLASGQSHAEIGTALGVSKQAIHKTASAALEKLRGQLAAQGFGGLDSEGLLKSATGNWCG